MSGFLAGAEVFVSLGFLAAAIFLVWIAKPRGDEPKFAFLKSETGQVVYTVFCIGLLAIGIVMGAHGFASFKG